ncbi:MAG: alpha/beta hydrolase [Myxococcota bacterium]|nr:alpha/beta hydrolase [Myxococcota bacterium]
MSTEQVTYETTGRESIYQHYVPQEEILFTLVFVHGWDKGSGEGSMSADTGLSWLAERGIECYSLQMEDLPQGFANYPTRIEETREFVETLGKMCILAGHSFGAHCAQAVCGAAIDGFSTEPPENLLAGILLSPPGGGAGLDDNSWLTLQVPVIVLTGTNDPSRTGDWTTRLKPYTRSRGIFSVGTALEGGDHDFGGFIGDEVDNPVFVDITRSQWAAFIWALAFNDPEAMDWLQRGRWLETGEVAIYAVKGLRFRR